MITLIRGIPDSGKSAFAEQLVTGTGKKSDRLYIATMIPFGKEGKKRVEKHRAMRKGKGFVTIECYGLPDEVLPEVKKYSSPIILLECISNLCANVMHMPGYEDKSEDELCHIIKESVLRLSTCCAGLYAVTNEFDSSNPGYDEETLLYIRLTHKVNCALKETADCCYEYEAGGFCLR